MMCVRGYWLYQIHIILYGVLVISGISKKYMNMNIHQCCVKPHMAVTMITFFHTARASSMNGICYNVDVVVVILQQMWKIAALALFVIVSHQARFSPQSPAESYT